jgi:methylmalonyl-CoA/ethylmalonyl-CoA epimerase
MALKRENVLGIEHVGVAVNNLEEAIQFMRGVFDVEASEIRESPENKVRGAMLDFGETKVELIQPTAPDTTVARFLQTRGEGIHHIAFRVNDVKAGLDKLKAKGLQVIDQAPRKGMFGSVGFVHPKSMHGVLVEFVQDFLPEHRPTR